MQKSGQKKINRSTYAYPEARSFRIKPMHLPKLPSYPMAELSVHTAKSKEEMHRERVSSVIDKSMLISRDLSWIQFNYRVLDQAFHQHRNVFERMKFLAITASNLDEFFMIRVGSLYNYLDYNKARVDYSGLREEDFKTRLFESLKDFVARQYNCLAQELEPLFAQEGFRIGTLADTTPEEQHLLCDYFKRTIYPMLTPMVYDAYHMFPILRSGLLVFCIVTKDDQANAKNKRKLSFVQVPQNLPRFFQLQREDGIWFIPIEEIIREHIDKLFRNVEILSTDLLRIIRNGDYTLEESEDLESDFIEELKRKIKTRRTGRVVRLEVLKGFNRWTLDVLKERWRIDDDNVFEIERLIDLSCLWEIIRHKEFSHRLPGPRPPVDPLTDQGDDEEDIFERVKRRDILVHRPFNSFETTLELLEQAAQDPNVLSIKMTIYRLAKDSRVTSALLKAIESGKHVSALFELKARFDEENNMVEAKKLQDAGCFVILGLGALKTHTKMMQVVRKEGDSVVRYVHMSSGNYNEDTSRFYTDISLLSCRETYAQDVSEFFNVITGHSNPRRYDALLTAPRFMRDQLIQLVNREAENARSGLPSGIVIKVNSLQDDQFIQALYDASQAGVPIKLIVRGICCLRPGREGMSENISVRSIVGNFLEHSRVFYFHNNGHPKMYGGSADAMVRSFDRRIESLFLIDDETCIKQCIHILHANLTDNVNAYEMREDGSYYPIRPANGEPEVNVHELFYYVRKEDIENVSLF